MHEELEETVHRIPRGGAFSGRTAALVHQLDLDLRRPLDVTVPLSARAHALAAIKTRRARLYAGDVVVVDGLPVTSVPRTLLDVALDHSLSDAVVAIDTALRKGLIAEPALSGFAASCTGRKGVKRFRRAVGLADSRSESPMETRLRVLLATARLPAPDVQRVLRDAAGEILGRPDLYYPAARLCIEYDGAVHRDQATMEVDARRQNRLLAAGYTVLRFTAADFRNPRTIVAEVRAAIRKTPQVVPHPRLSA